MGRGVAKLWAEVFMRGMRLVSAAALLVLMTAGVSVIAQAKPDFSGQWTIDIQRSDRSIQANEPRVAFPSTITIKHSGADMELESASTRQDPIKATYKLDGPEVTIP